MFKTCFQLLSFLYSLQMNCDYWLSYFGEIMGHVLYLKNYLLISKLYLKYSKLLMLRNFDFKKSQVVIKFSSIIEKNVIKITDYILYSKIYLYMENKTLQSRIIEISKDLL